MTRPRSSLASLVIVLVLAAVAACASSPLPAPARPVAAAPTCRHEVPRCEGAPPSYADLRPLLERRCFSCHAGNGVAADDHDFAREATLRAQRLDVQGEVEACAMPPRGAPPLTEGEAAVLLRWAACAP